MSAVARTDRGGASPLVTRAGLARGGSLVVLLAAAPLLASANWMVNLLFFTVLYAAMATAWNLIGGYAGYPSLGHAAFFGVGAYATADVFRSSHVLHSGYEPFLVLPVIGIAVGILALPVGAIAMRTRADVFAIVTITLLFVVQTLAFNLKGLTGGAQGAGLAPPPFPVETFERPFYFAAVTLLLLAMLISYGASRSKVGLALAAIRGDEDKARGLGVPTLGVKVVVFSVSIGLMAMAGGIWAYYIGFVYPQFAVDPLITIAIVLMTFLGGRATLWGPVLGAAILMPAQQLLAYYIGGSRLYLVGYATVFLVIMVLLPRGIVSTLVHRRRLVAMTSRAAAPTGAGVPAAGEPLDLVTPRGGVPS